LIKNTHTDQELWEGCLKQDRKVQHALFVQFLPVMFGVCRRYTKSKMDAEDLVQDGFMVVFREIKNYKGGSLEGWMRKIFINLSINQFRKESRRQSWLVVDTEEAIQIQDPVQEVGRDFLETERILECINQLPEGTRLAFNLYAVEGYSHAEIAQILNIQESTSRVQVSRARRILMEMVPHPNTR